MVDCKTQQFGNFAKNVDVVLGTVGGETRARSFAVLKPGGLLITFPPRQTPPRLAKSPI